MSELVAVLDANVLYSASIRDLLLRLALAGLFKPRWTNSIQLEWINALLKKRPDLSKEKLEWTLHEMNRHFIDACIYDHEEMVPSLILPDPKDRHVLAAAIKSQAELIITYNLKDFPEKSISQLGISALHPDNFVVRLFDFEPSKVILGVKKHRAALKSPAISPLEYLHILERNELTQTVSILKAYIDLI